MKEWQTNLIGSTIVIVMGVGVLLVASSLQIPSPYRTFLGIPYGVNPEYALAFSQMITLLLLGTFIMGVGVGILLNTYPIYRLEKKLVPRT